MSQFACNETRADTKKRTGRPAQPDRAVPRGIGLKQEEWAWIEMFWEGESLSQKVQELILYVRRFAPRGRDGGHPRDTRGRFLPR